jgi:hypothetical protein
MSRRLSPLAAVLIAAVLASAAVALPTAASGPSPSRSIGRAVAGLMSSAAPAAPDALIVRYRNGVDADARAVVRRAVGATRTRDLSLITAEVVRPARGESLEHLRAALEKRPEVIYAVPDYHRSISSAPWTEPLWPCEWGLQNTGLPVTDPALAACNDPGTAGVDIRARSAYPVTMGDPKLVVAVIDDGVDFSHPDLSGHSWINLAEANGKPGVDDDGDGLIDDVNGWDFCHGDATIHDANNDFHGTAVSSVIAGSVNDVGIAGVAPKVTIMALKFLDDPPTGQPTCGSDSDAIAAIQYAVAHGAKIINASWGGPENSLALKQAIDAAGAAGVLFVAAAGNGNLAGVGQNIDVNPDYPAAFTSTNIVSVAAVDKHGALADFSNYGLHAVDISAPGVSIATAIPPYAGQPAGWVLIDGTSFAAPMVTGVAALALSVRPDLVGNPIGLRAHLLATGRSLASTSGMTVSGRIVDAGRAVDLIPPTAVTPSAGLKSAQVSHTAGIVHVAWPAATDASGIAYYTLQQRLNGGAWTTLTNTAGTSVDRAVPFGATAEFQVRARDSAGNVGAWRGSTPLRMTVYQESSAAFTYRYTWTRATMTTALGGHLRYATRSGARATFSFTGRGAAWIAPRGPTRGSAKIYLDGVYVKTVSLYARTSVARQVIFSRNGLTSTHHTLRIVVVGTRSHPRVDMDAIIVSR